MGIMTSHVRIDLGAALPGFAAGGRRVATRERALSYRREALLATGCGANTAACRPIRFFIAAADCGRIEWLRHGRISVLNVGPCEVDGAATRGCSERASAAQRVTIL